LRDSALNEDKRLTVAEAAEELGVSERTARNLIHRGELVAYRVSARKTWILRPDLDAFIESRRTSTTTASN